MDGEPGAGIGPMSMMRWYDLSLLRRVPKWVHLIWLLTTVIIVFCAIQQATHWFYGPSVTLYGDGVTYRCQVTEAWLVTLGLIAVPLTWYVIWCSKGFGIGCITLIGASSVIVAVGFVATEVFGQSTLAGHSWDFTGDAGKGLAGGFSEAWILRFIADPAGEFAPYVLLFGALMLLLMIPIRDSQSRYRYTIVGQECMQCGYSLKGTPNKICPECGQKN